MRTPERHFAGLPSEEAIRAMAWAWALASALDGTGELGWGQAEQSQVTNRSTVYRERALAFFH